MNTFILIVTVFVTFAPDARAGRCLGELNGPTGEQAVQILRTLQDIAPTLSVEELAAQPRRVRALTEKLGFARTPKALEADLKRLFGHRIAALEFAGFDTSTLPNPTPDRDDWTPKLVRDGIRLGRYGAEFDPTPRGFLLQWRRIEAGLAKGWGRPVSAYSLWRAARAQYGNYQSALARTDGRADPHDRASHSSDAIRRLPLIPGAAAARRAESVACLERFRRSTYAQKYPGLAEAFAEYLNEHDEFTDRLNVIRCLTRSSPGMEWLRERTEIINALDPPRP